MSTLPEEVGAPLTAGVGMSHRLTFQVFHAWNDREVSYATSVKFITNIKKILKLNCCHNGI